MYKRPIYTRLIQRAEEPRRFIQVLAGPRQVGKTTLAHQMQQALSSPAHYASADELTLRDLSWIEQQWEIGRLYLKQKPHPLGALLILDEVQKIPNWSDSVKRLWDQDTRDRINLKVMILGSSTLLVQKGLSESLAGRFEVIPIGHWSFKECQEAFDWDLDRYVYFGGYPGAFQLTHDEGRWSQYVVNSLIETSISRDILLMARIHKPALLRRVLELGCYYSGQVFSYQKMLGQLHDAGNATTLAHYLDLLSKAGLITGLPKFSFEPLRQKASSPKFQVLNNALITAQGSLSFEETQHDRERWGRLIKSAIGAHLVNATLGGKMEVGYWQEGNKEVDFVLKEGETILAIDVKSSKQRTSLPGMDAFSRRFQMSKKLLVGGQGLPLKDFLLHNPGDFL